MTSSRIIPAAAAVTLLWVLGSAAAAQQPRPMTIVDLIDVPSISDPRLSPDGAQLLYTRTDADWDRNETVTHIWRAGVDGSGAVQLTNGEDRERSPRWSPDGRRIAFLAERGDDEHAQIYLIPNDGGEAHRLSQHATRVSDIDWSPDGQWIYFVAADEKTAEETAREELNDNVFAFDEDYKQRHLWRIRVADATEVRLTDGDFSIDSYSLSRDGEWLVHVRRPSPRLDDGPLGEVWLMRASGREPRQLTSNTVGEGSVELSPDGTRVLFVANANADLSESYYNDKIFVVPVAGGAPELLLPDLAHEVNSASWSADGRSVFFLANSGVRQELFRVELEGLRVTQLTRGDHTVSSWSYSPALDQHVFTVSSPSNAGDVWRLAGDGGAPLRITRVFDYLAREFRLPQVEAVTWPGEDGVSVEGLLYYPLDFQRGERYRLVVQTHGGPAASDKFAWHSSSAYVPVLTALGYMVLKPNYRGSTGYGDAFLRDMVGGYFNQAHKDVMAGVDHLIARGLVDGDRMAKMGWSAGGHMTNKIITYTDRFKAASSGAGAVNWLSMYAQSDTRVYRTPWFGGTPWQEDAPIEAYIQHSPLFEIHKVRTPTLVLVGQNDERVPMPQSVELYRALRTNGVPTKLYVAPRQGHGWRELQQRLFKANVELDWFERWVRQRSYTWERSPVHPPATATAENGSQGQRTSRVP
ncbi:MAG: LpqB family beta-propeller domain-containing protein [Longimicrobiales bacterium]